MRIHFNAPLGSPAQIQLAGMLNPTRTLFVAIGTGPLIGEGSQLFSGMCGHERFWPVGTSYLPVPGVATERRLAFADPAGTAPRPGMPDLARSAVIQVEQNGNAVDILYKLEGVGLPHVPLTPLENVSGMDVVFRLDGNKLAAQWSATAPVQSGDPTQRPVRYRMTD